jgi:hypothetical protein
MKLLFRMMTVKFKVGGKHVCMLPSVGDPKPDFMEKLFSKMDTTEKLKNLDWLGVEDILKSEIKNKAHNNGTCNPFLGKTLTICKEKITLGQCYQIYLHYCLNHDQQVKVWDLWREMGKPYEHQAKLPSRNYFELIKQ